MDFKAMPDSSTEIYYIFDCLHTRTTDNPVFNSSPLSQ